MPIAPVCFDSSALVEKGEGLRFSIPTLGPHATGFVIRFEGKAYAYVNRCAHVPVELDWTHGQFFDSSQTLLICATHGAMYAPQSGHCVLGPCRGKQLTALPVTEQNGRVCIHLDRDQQ